MKIHETIYRPGSDCPDILAELPGRCLFFDIETTGLSSRFHQVYLIGATYPEGEDWHFIQWFADTAESERDVLKDFTSFLMSFDTLVHFNGDTFDIPFLKGRMAFYGLSDPFPLFTSVDLFRKCRPLKKILPLGSLKLKVLESFLGIHREDPYTGGELIEVYDEFLMDRSPQKEHDLMLHNEEDVRGMPDLLPIFRFLSLPEARFRLLKQQEEVFRDLSGEEKKEIYLRFESSVTVPCPFTNRKEGGTVRAEGNLLTLRLLPEHRKLKHFFPNYRDYLYLTTEEKVVHKSVGQFVDPAFRRKAAPEECFAEREGWFLPQKKALITPAFQEERKGKQYFFEYQDPLPMDEETATEYVRQFLLQ